MLVKTKGKSRERIVENSDGIVWTGFIWLRIALVNAVMNLRLP
jgi:hypothetical protein